MPIAQSSELCRGPAPSVATNDPRAVLIANTISCCCSFATFVFALWLALLICTNSTLYCLITTPIADAGRKSQVLIANTHSFFVDNVNASGNGAHLASILVGHADAFSFSYSSLAPFVCANVGGLAEVAYAASSPVLAGACVEFAYKIGTAVAHGDVLTILVAAYCA